MKKKYVKNDNFGKKEKQIKKTKNHMWGKLKLDYQPAQY